MSLATPNSVQTLQRAIHAKTKDSVTHRFHNLYDKVYREDVLTFAYRLNGGVAGVDGQTFEDIEEYGEKRWLSELADRPRNQSYQPQAVRRVWFPKPVGKQRPLGIPTIADRVMQMAVVLILESISRLTFSRSSTPIDRAAVLMTR